MTTGEGTATDVPAAHRQRNRRWTALVLAGLVAAGFVAWRAGGRGGGAAAGGRSDAGTKERAVPVSLVPVVQRDVPIYLEGLGSVTALATVTVRSQVDGRLDRVFFEEGRKVKKGDVLAQVDPRPFRIQLQQAEGALARDLAQLENARRDLRRYNELAQKNLIPQQQADSQVALVSQAEGTVMMDRAAVSNAQLLLDYSRIAAPVDGVTGIRQVDPGNLVHASDASGIVVLTQLDPIAVIFTLPQDDLPRLSRAMSEGELTVDAYNRDGSAQLATGKLVLIDNQINPTTATLRLKAVFPNPEHVLWPNLFVRARLHLTTRKDAVVVPSVAVQRGREGNYVYVAAADSTATLRHVEVESTEGQLALIANGLAPGDRVVSEGQAQLSPGARIQPQPPNQPQPPSAGGRP